ncbi:hypothetical protein NDI76_11775 [Halogeometricum sp. S1BR25-6]|uniref:Uncharacterized protein n=1 Tax=Halogeometricum salsisoli TaxID=2950536 RepID=A0ABU2GG60_9EURY|nr:hypothetical protein [Halogeometricum sp. S1BR25-6]MDS0299421.1 hypothetical protein [Halogeometricum sp. S1BR25-6]
MYAETDFLLALIKDEDWLGEAAETVYREHRDELWTSQFTSSNYCSSPTAKTAIRNGSSRMPRR